MSVPPLTPSAARCFCKHGQSSIKVSPSRHRKILPAKFRKLTKLKAARGSAPPTRACAREPEFGSSHVGHAYECVSRVCACVCVSLCITVFYVSVCTFLSPCVHLTSPECFKLTSHTAARGVSILQSNKDSINLHNKTCWFGSRASWLPKHKPGVITDPMIFFACQRFIILGHSCLKKKCGISDFLDKKF